VINEDSPHESRGNAQKVCAIRPVDRGTIGESQKYFVHKGRGLQCVIFSLAPHVPAGKTPHFSFNERDQAFKRGSVAGTPGAKEPGNHVAGRRGRPHVRP
jgi:hypothetical protein